ncbi:InlB B-repeat-containing protein [Candidatus Saccharibacteria bacterium]|nr:InlB B-repeat-containing protein [Candidatus Saccharibacteria bacterium]
MTASQRGHSRWLFAMVCTGLIGFFLVFNAPPVEAIAKQSTLTISLENETPTIYMSAASFEKTDDVEININTDNFTGYNLSIASQNSRSITSTNGSEITSISSAIDETTFSSSSAYNNKWGYRPSQYVTTSGGVYTTVLNTDFLPASYTDGSLLAVTNAANSVDHTYSVAFGVNIGPTLPAGTYTYTYVLRAVANSIVYNITYNDNTNETVTNMPSPNPQALTIDGGTPAAESYASLSNAVPTMTSANMTFGGWCDVATTVDSSTGNYVCSGTTYDAGDDYPIDQTVSGANITLYAIWINDPFPVVWDQMGKCVFNNGTINGSACQDYTSYDFIDTGIALYSSTNYDKDYEVHFTIDSYVPSSQPDTQSTIFNDKLSSSVEDLPYGGKSPGIIVRRNNGKPIEIKSTYGAPTDYSEIRYVDKDPPATAYSGTDIRIFRIDGVIYTSVDNGPLIFLQDYTSFNQQFGLSAWFGAYPENVDCTVGCTAAKRYFTGELSNMYIKLGEIPASYLYSITYNANGGTPNTTTYKVLNGNSLGEFPTATRSGWLFDGWYTGQYDGQKISTATVPTANTTYWAHWKLSVADAAITNTDISLSVNGTETINITNASNIEPYTLSSSNTSVATVNASGIITAVNDGVATITMTGTMSGDTRTITVSVGNLIHVNFYSQGATPSSFTWPVAENSSFSSLPEPTKLGYTFNGWYTGLNGTGTQLTTSTVFNSNTPTLYYANWQAATYVCKIATTLHEESCGQTGSNGCRNGNLYASGATIRYGSLVTSTEMHAGDAYTCDINYDNVFDEATERFYYFGTANGKSKFVYYKNLQDTDPPLYNDALAMLPTSSDPGWDNPNLSTFSGDYNGAVARFMTYPEALALCNNETSDLGTDGKCLYLLEKTAFANADITDGVWLEKQTNYANRIQTRSRALTHGKTSNNAPRPTIEVANEYVEPYTAPATTYEITFNPHNGDNNTVRQITVGAALNNNYPSSDPTYTDHVFQGWYTAVSGGTLVTDQTVPDGDWVYHAQWKGTVALAQVVSNAVSVVEGNTTTISITNVADLEAFTFSSSNTNIATVDSSTGVVTALAEGTTTISITGTNSHAVNNIVTVTVLDASSTFRVTFDPQNGDSTSFVDVQAGNTIGAGMPQNNPTYTNHVFQRWYDTSNNNTVTSATEVFGAMTVYAEWKLDITQAIISDSELILTVGDQLAVTVNNSANLEPYTFSSGDTSVATVDVNTGVITGVSAGTATITLTGTQSNLTKTISVEVTPAPTPKWTVTFNANGGSTPTPSASSQVDDGDPVGSLPTTTRANYRFFGWYKDDGTFYEEVTPATTVSADVTYYARWIEDTTSFPIVWAEVNACTFNGTSHITGAYCLEDAVTGNSLDLTKHYIDTAVKLFSADNYQKDFEIGFNVVSYNDSASPSQATFVTSKAENLSGWPGFTMRKNGTDTVQLTERFSMDSTAVSTPNVTASTLKQVRIARIDQKIYYSWNGAAYTLLQDISQNTTRFDTNTWFGATLNSAGTGTQRPIYATFTDMYIRLGNPTEYVIEFDPNGGSFTNSSDSSKTITINDPVGNLPVPTPPTVNHTFIGWFDESTSPATQVSTLTVPSGNKTYVAHYSYTSSNTPVTFDVSNDATRDYNTLISSWVQSPINITTFNEASPINNSTWGDTTELSEAQFWSDMEDNFEDNNCMASPLSDVKTGLNWTTGSVDCSKPDAYDTKINASLTVRLDNAQGAIVNYTKADDGVIHNMIPGQTYYWEKTSDSTVYGYVTATSNGSSTGTRWVDTGTIRNVRDLGGLPVSYTDGNNQTVTGTLAYGRLFRGEKLGSAAATELVNLGITTEYNVGDEYSSDTHLGDYHLSQVVHYNFDYNSGDENNANSNYMKAWNAVTSVMQDITNTNTAKNVYIHCRVGADRTGTLAYLLEGLLGVPDEARYEEYELTYLSGQYDRTRYYKEKSSSNNLKFVFMMSFVKTTQDIYDWYMSNPNADASLIQAFRTAMTVTTPGRSLQSSAPAQETSTLSQNNDSSDDTEPNDGYVLPLGVFKSTLDEKIDENTESISQYNTELAVAAAAAVVASGAAFSVALAKRLTNDDNGQQQAPPTVV